MLKIFKVFFYFPKNRPWPTISTLAIVGINNLVEGISIGWLIPLLEAINGQTGTGSSSNIANYLHKIFDIFSIPFELWTILLGGLFINSLTVLLKYFSETHMMKVSSYFSAEIKTKLFKSLLKTDLHFFQEKENGDLVNIISKETDRFSAVFLHSIRLISQCIACAVYLTIALFLAWDLVIVAIGLMGIIFISIKYEFKRADQLGEDLLEANKNVSVKSLEYLNGIRVIKAFGIEKFSLQEFKNHAYSLFQVTYDASKSRERLVGVFQIGMVSALILSIYLAVTFSNISLPVLLTFVFLLYRFYPKVGGINKAYHQLTFCTPGAIEVLKLIDQTKHPKVTNGPMTFVQLKKEVSFENVKFHYPNGHPILQNINLKIQAGKTTALVGSSGQGKTTIVNLMMRFYDPSSGSITVDKTDLKSLNVDNWRSSIALVNQDIFLFNDTIKNNISIGKSTVEDSEIKHAMELAHVTDFVKDLPEGQDTVIGDRGIRLSGGQRQRIALARAIIRKPQMLILDEATSELDNLSEKLIHQAVQQLGSDTTIVIVAHRLSTILQADQIVVLENGQVIESGNHEDLIQINGRYAEFLGIQNDQT